MYTLNIRGLNWITIKNSCCLLCCIFLFACSTTKHVSTHDFSENNYFHEYHEYEHDDLNDQFYTSHFTQVNKSIHQNTLHSDHQLMMSLLNRPVAADQAMMIAFKQERMNYTSSVATYGVEIKGNKSTEKLNYRPISLYTNLISQDINAVNINAPD